MELRRLGRCEGVSDAAEQLFGLVTLAPVPRAVLEQASLIDPIAVRSLDAIHLATARDLHDTHEIAAVLTYDRKLQAGCRHHGIPVQAPTV